MIIPPVAARRTAQSAVLAAAAAAMAGGGVALAVAPGVVVGAVALPVVGLLLLPALPIVLELAEQRAGPAGGRATALLWLSGNAGGIVIALVIQAAIGSPALAFVLLAASGALAAPLARRLHRLLHDQQLDARRPAPDMLTP